MEVTRRRKTECLVKCLASHTLALLRGWLWLEKGDGNSKVCSVLHPSQDALQHQSLSHHGLRQVILLLHLLTTPLQYLLHQVALERGVHHLFVLHAATDSCTQNEKIIACIKVAFYNIIVCVSLTDKFT